MENLQKFWVVIRCVDSRDEAVSDVMYAGGSDTVQTGEMQCKETMLKSKLLLVLEAEMENMQNFRWFTLFVGHCDDQCKDDLFAW